VKISKKALLGAATAVTLTAFCGLAAAKDAAMHTMTVQSPDGGTVTIRYSGDVAPKVAFGSAPQMAGFTGYNSPFAMMQRISSEMDRRMAAMMSQANAMMAHLPDANPTIPANFWNMPMNMPGLSAIAAGGKGSFCMKSVEITSNGDGKSPHVVTHTAGDCAGGSAPAHTTGGKGPKTPI